MILGNKSSIAVECELNPAIKAVVGRIVLWANDFSIGDGGGGIDLPLVLDILAGPLQLAGRRHCGILDKMTKEELVSFFLSIRYEEDGALSSAATDDILLVDRFLVLSAYSVEGFDSAFVLIVGKPQGGDRFIWKRKDDPKVYESFLGPGEYDAVVLAFSDWLFERSGYDSQFRRWFAMSDFEKNRLRTLAELRIGQSLEGTPIELADRAAIAELRRACTQ